MMGTALPKSLFVNRELSWLEFNKRVLLESLDDAVPLFERLKFEAIYFSNLDEFFMVRVGSLTDQSLLDAQKTDDKTGMNADEQIAAIIEKVASFAPLCESAYGVIRQQLKELGVDLVDVHRINQVEELIAQKYFLEDILPLLSPQIIDRHHPFPFLKSKEQYVISLFATKDEVIKLGIVPVSHLPQYFVFSVDNRQKVVFTADIVCHFAQKLYSKYEIVEKNILRVTRNADISVNEGLFDYDVDFRGIMQELLKKRRRLSIVRAQLAQAPSERLRRHLCKRLGIASDHIMVSGIPLDFSFGFSLPGNLNLSRKDLSFRELRPSLPIDFSKRDAIKYCTEHDVLLSYPFQSMKPFIDLLYAAAEDPTVVSIKISLYRLANRSRIASALCAAAERGKEVLCVLELRARFDEQSNIDYAKLLEDAGCTVIYGLSDYKVHAKLCLITRKVHGKIVHLTQIGTGNYNEKTAELYTDLCLITSDETVGQDANDIFGALCMGETVERTRTLWAAPNCYLDKVLCAIDEEIAIQKAGGEGYVGIKVNSLNCMEVMEKLVEASRAGVQIELFIRGICCIRPGVEGYTDLLTVRSVVGRYLEHSRIFVFGRGSRQQIYIGSGDLLNRNTHRRVEVFAGVRSPDLRARVLEILDAFRRDNVKAWDMLPDGSYVKPPRTGDEAALESQIYLQEYFAAPFEEEGQPQAFGGRLRGLLDRLGGRARKR